MLFFSSILHPRDPNQTKKKKKPFVDVLWSGIWSIRADLNITESSNWGVSSVEFAVWIAKGHQSWKCWLICWLGSWAPPAARREWACAITPKGLVGELAFPPILLPFLSVFHLLSPNRSSLCFSWYVSLVFFPLYPFFLALILTVWQ